MGAALAEYQSLMESAVLDVRAFCTEHAWLAEIRQFTLNWQPESVQAWRRAQAYTIEVSRPYPLPSPSSPSLNKRRARRLWPHLGGHSQLQALAALLVEQAKNKKLH